MTRLRVTAVVSITAVVLAGCASAGPPTPPSSDYYGLGAGGAARPVLGVETPAEGATVGSPVAVYGTTAGSEPGDRLAAQVLSIEADGSTRWRGNVTLRVDTDGRYSGEIPYSLDAASEGMLEVVVVSDTGEPRARIRVRLNLMPAGSTDGDAP